MTINFIQDPLFGPAAPALGWVPAPRYLMRRARLVRLFEPLSPGTMLEVGPGAGSFLIEATRRGWDCQAYEISAGARKLAGDIFSAFGVSIPIAAEPDPGWIGRFDLLCSCEVLEHIEDDRSALAQWRSWLKPNGTLILSVPAHMRQWTAGDEWAGHFRRYERADLEDLLRNCGFTVDAFECYGFPLTNISERMSARTYARRIQNDRTSGTKSMQSNTERSGIDRGPHLRIYPYMTSWPGKFGLRCCMKLQSLFTRTELGSGYILRARRT